MLGTGSVGRLLLDMAAFGDNDLSVVEWMWFVMNWTKQYYITLYYTVMSTPGNIFPVNPSAGGHCLL